MGTLGTTADDLERRLKEILNLSAKGNAIILLDEADSFLEKRSSTSSLERNAMVCVMLQLVEYFSGILFLTSNRIDSLDPAFQTRITLSRPDGMWSAKDLGKYVAQNGGSPSLSTPV
jgi:SpoVK/Ycf46/Vps4 family AAA+-type ATPase